MKELALQKFSQLASSLGVTKLTPDEAQAIVGLSRLAIDADRSVDGDELDLYDDLGDLICELAGTKTASRAGMTIAPRGSRMARASSPPRPRASSRTPSRIS